MEIAKTQKELHEWAKAYYSKKEWHMGNRFAHLHEEVSESWKEWREGRLEQYMHTVKKHGHKLRKPEGLPAEMADVMILCMVTAEELGIDLEKAIEDKAVYLAARLDAKERQKAQRKAS